MKITYHVPHTSFIIPLYLSIAENNLYETYLENKSQTDMAACQPRAKAVKKDN